MIYHFYLDFSFLRLGKAFPVFFLKSYERLFLNRLPPDRPIIYSQLFFQGSLLLRQCCNDNMWRILWALRWQPKYWYWYWLFWRHELASSADLEGRVCPCGYRNGRSKPLSLAVWLSYAAKQYFKGSKGPAWLELTIENWPKQKFGQGSCSIITSLFTKFLQVSRCQIQVFLFFLFVTDPINRATCENVIEKANAKVFMISCSSWTKGMQMCTLMIFDLKSSSQSAMKPWQCHQNSLSGRWCSSL